MSAAELFEAVPEYPDHCSRAGALALKIRIEAYWRERGHIVHITLREAGFHAAIRAARYDIRSDLFNGQPMPAAIKREAA